MKLIYKSICALLTASISISSIAQESATGYFMENYNMRWQMNPAMGNKLGYVGLPALGNVNVGMNGNLSASDLIYTHNGRTVLFTNPEISTREVMDNIGNNNRLILSSGINVLQAGFKAFGGYNNVAVNVKDNVSLNLPGSIFSFLKEGVSNQTYDIKNLRAKAIAYAEIALNHSHDIKQVPGLRAGVSLKLLLPFAFADADFNELTLELDENNWKANAHADMRVGLRGVRYETDINDRTGNRYVSGFNADDIKYGPNGFGLAFDLGATYQWNDFNFSLALTDLGLLNFNSVQEASTNGVKNFETAAHPIGIGDDGNSWDNLVDDLSSLYELHDNGEIGPTSIGLQGKLRVGADYKFPLYDKLHFGLMNTTNLSSVFPMTEFRISANVAPVKGVAASVSAAAGSYGANYGFLLSLGNKGFNFVIGMDYAAFKMDKNHIPLSSNCDLHMGINFPF